jgi:predicted nucleic acid-binding protein
MILVDVNLLIYAVNEDSPDHHNAKSWLETAVSGTGTVGLPSIVLLAFLRLTTRSGLFQKPLSVDAAFDMGASSVLCKRRFFLAPQANLGGGKVGILVLDFHFSTAHI